jgi:ADP-heptose:LPS heptosyltransferase
MQTAREFASNFYTQKVPQDSAGIHVIDYYQKIAAATGAATRSDDYNLTPSPQAVESANALLTGQNLAGRKYAVLVPGSAHADKCWPKKNFAQLAEKMASQFNLDIVTVGTTDEKTITENINSLANVPIIDMAGKTDIPQLIALLNGAEIVISNDTGPGHIAAALGTATVMIFGLTNPARIGPYKKPHAIAAVDPYDRPHKIESNDPAHRIDTISVDEVFRKVAAQLTAAPQ